MKNLISILLVLSSFICNGQVNIYSHNNRINELIEKNNNSTISKAEKFELQKYGYNIQNRGMLSVEHHQDYQNALAPIDSAISFWIMTKDTANEANLRKFKGMILGHLNRFEEGKLEINKAISLYESINVNFGIAVSKYDMSQLLDMEGSIDSALIYQLEATNFWINRKDTFRIIVNNNQLIHLYCKKGLYQKAELIQKSNEFILKPDLHWNPKINFYYVSYILFKLEGNEDKENAYKKLYFDKLQLLKEKENIETKSIYDKG
jgi:tetratricopeptide (TPR) repeat protein